MLPRKDDYLALPHDYQRFFDSVKAFVNEERLIIDPVRTLAYGTDASFYRLVPKIVVKAENAEEVAKILKIADASSIPVTFRTAGTSLSGQAVSDSVLILLASGFKNFKVLREGHQIALEPGIIGAAANTYLARYGRKIGPDPASIATAMIGGIAANNASGMCCGTSQNSYRTVESMKIIFADGTVLDTADRVSRERFLKSHGDLLSELAAIRNEILKDHALAERIRDKYRIKNTTGYGLNSFIDFADPFDILLHLMIGSEGTLAFMSEITYNTVIEHQHKASALMFLPDLRTAGEATAFLSTAGVSAVELMDRASLRAVENKRGLPPILKTLPETATCLLIEIRAASQDELGAQIEKLEESLSKYPLLAPIKFTAVKAEFETYWDIRRGLFPAVGANRKTGTTVVIEDVAFKIERLSDAIVDLQSLMREHGYHEGIIFGHALDGNVHFVFTQNFDRPEEVARYEKFMDEVADLVIKKYDGAMKAEHGTGRNIAPFVEAEWGPKAHGLMKRVKKAFDPKDILNPGVIITEKAKSHLDNLKPLPAVHEIVDKCIECGFCEPKCPSKDLTLSPRQRTVVQREVARLERTGEDPERLKRIEEDWEYLGDDTCATCGLCATSCPVSIDTGKFTKALRAEKRTPMQKRTAQIAADNYGLLVGGVRASLSLASVGRTLIGTTGMKTLTRGLSKIVGIPAWHEHAPKSAGSARFEDTDFGFERKVVYFPSCIARAMGPSSTDKDQRPLHDVTLSLLKKAGYDVIFPQGLANLCCGLTFESKGFPQQGDQKLRELEKELLARSNNGEIPIISDTSPCLHRMKLGLDPRLKVYEPIEFVHDHLLCHLDIRKVEETVAVHITCSTTKLGLSDKLRAVAQACATNVVIPPDVGCCGFAGDKGFTTPELNASALRNLKKGIGASTSGYSNSRGCEVGLSKHSGISYQSLLYLVDRCAIEQTVKMIDGAPATAPKKEKSAAS